MRRGPMIAACGDYRGSHSLTVCAQKFTVGMFHRRTAAFEANQFKYCTCVCTSDWWCEHLRAGPHEGRRHLWFASPSGDATRTSACTAAHAASCRRTATQRAMIKNNRRQRQVIWRNEQSRPKTWIGTLPGAPVQGKSQKNMFTQKRNWSCLWIGRS